MKRLILMRHAKSDWSDLAASDHERTLNKRGRRSAEAIGDWMRSKSLQPDHVLCSDAARTRETLSLLKLDDVPTTVTPRLYLAEPDVMAHELHSRDEDCIVMLAHNPGSAMLADMLLAKAPDHPDFDTFPTCATIVADFNITNWRDLRHGTGRVVEFIVPRDLIE
ncbi:SixA phosphatase family protein [Sulfitobacter sp.]|uniref:SixA phosphatase family protein n=1 Tax=Sulfitobacter sp. TaxID=1903071 RepID=UPI0030030D3A